MKVLFSILFVSITMGFNCFSQNQFGFERNDSIVVKIVNDTLKMAWDGGLNYAQFSNIDYDYDGDLDLFVFDRSNDQPLLFENKLANGARAYKKVLNAHLLFPIGIRNRSALVDFNGDGKADLFTYAPGGVRVYKNTGNSTTGLVWTLYKNFIKTEYPGITTFLFVSSSDIPSYIDVDNDLDLDVLTFSQGGDRVEYHQNQSRELYGHSDSLTFIVKNECWGKFKESATDNAIILNDNTVPCINGSIPNPLRQAEKDTFNVVNQKMHTGSTLLALDIDNSGVLDLVLGDVTSTNMVLLKNGGTTVNSNSAMISVDVNFPSNTLPVNMDVFPAAFHLDVNFDGKRDILVGANARGISKNEKSVIFYENTGTEVLPIFTQRSKAFLQEEMIEHGVGSMPSFLDYDADGLLDMIVGINYRYKPTQLKESALTLYKNTGTATQPEFTYVTNNYLNLLNAGFGFRIAPAFGDIDSDGDQDMMIGTELGKVHLFVNSGGPNLPVNFSSAPILNLTNNLGTVITTTSFSSPQMFDLDNDNLLDLILGKKNGEIAFYKNTGTSTSYQFTLINNVLGNIDISPTTPEGYSFPHFFRKNDTTYLFVNGELGTLRFYDSIQNHLAAGQSFHLRNDKFLDINVGYEACFTTNDIDNDGKLDLFYGQDLGGISHFEVNPNSTVSLTQTPSFNFELFPNPSTNLITIRLLETSKNSKLTLFSLDGKLLYSDEIKFEKAIDISLWSRGTYILRVENNNGMATKRIVKI